MAIFHLEGKIISRSQGRSCVAAATYRACTHLVDNRTGLTHDFTNKKPDLAYSEILLPVSAPDWMKERELLWNHIEAIEKRKDAQLARELTISLPKEFTSEQNSALAKEFIQREFVDLGMVADICIHHGHKTTEGQPHIHVMLSLREVTPDGFGQKVRRWNDKALILHWREAWANECNRHLALHGFDLRIDHRTLEAQGIDLEPQSKIGAKIAKEKMARFEEHQRIAERNGQRLLRNPSLVLTAITQYQSTFNRHDIAKFIARHSIDEKQFAAIETKVMVLPELVYLGQDERNERNKNNRNTERYTTKAMITLEANLLTKTTQLMDSRNHTVSKIHQRRALAHKTLNDEQQVAFHHIIQSNDITCLIGFAGTGKSYLLGAAKDTWEKQGYKVQGMTLSGIAAENLENGSGIQSHTLANRFIHWQNNKERLNHKDVIVIDEAGMIGSQQMATLIEEATAAKAKVVLVGDTEQLQAIEAGAAFRAMTERTGYIELTQIQRQKQTWQQHTTQQLATKETTAALSTYAEHHHVHEHIDKDEAINALIEQWQETRSHEPHNTHLILAYTRDDVKQLNEAARHLRKQNQELGNDIQIQTHRGNREFAQGDVIYFLRNEKSLNVKNGTLGTIEQISHHQLTVRIKSDNNLSTNPRTIQFHISDYNDIDHGYAATIHKSQGSTVDRSFVLASKHFDRHTTYVALTRHKDSAELFYAKSEFKDFDNLTKTLSRERAKDITTDYSAAIEFAKLRGFKIQPAKSEQVKEEARIFADIDKMENQKRFDDLLKNAATKNQRQDNHSERQQGFAAFKQQFETEHQTQAQNLKETIIPTYEREAKRLEMEFRNLEKRQSQSNAPYRAQEDLECLSATIAKENTIMTYLKQHNPTLADKVKMLTKTHGRNKELDQEFER